MSTTDNSKGGRRRLPSEAPEVIGYDGSELDENGHALAVEGTAAVLTFPTEAVEVVEPTRLDRWLDGVRSGDAALSRPRPTWLVEQFLPGNAWGAIYGPPGKGKSFHTLSLALELARGGVWAGRSVEPMNVLYVVAEKQAIHTERLEAWALHHRLPIPDRFADIVARPQLCEPSQVADLVAVIKSLGARFVVIDTLAQCMIGKDENSAKDMGPVADGIDELVEATNGGTVHVVHHAGKDVSKGMRGSTALLGSAHYTWEITGDATATKVQVQKMNAGRDDVPADWFKLHPVELPPDDDGRPRGSAVMVSSSYRLAVGSADDKRLRVVLEALGDAYADHGITRAEVQRLCGVEQSTAGTTLTRGKTLGWLTSTGSGMNTRYWLTDDGRAQLPD